jgi:acyl-CoA synthetase (AMP-forming)/AMP-acid ligase II
MINTMLTLLNSETLANFKADGYWRNETIYATAARHARLDPDAFAIRDRRRRLTYSSLIESADALASDLHGRGVRPGERVAVWLPSCVETAVALLACSRNGYVCCPSLHRDHTVGEIVALIERMRAAVVIGQAGYGADGSRYDLFAEIAGRPYLKHVYQLAAQFSGSGRTAFDEHLASLSQPPTAQNSDPNLIVYLPFTSGTTGQPKGVMHSDNTLLASARALAEDWCFSKETTTYTLSPLSHNLGLGALISSLVSGGELVVHDLPRAESLLDRLVETKASFLFGVPTHAIDLLSELRVRGIDKLGRVTGFRISGAAATPEVLSELMRYGITPQSGYGMTETCSHQYTLPTDDPALIAETCGRSCAGYEVRIWRQDNPNIEAEVGEVGQIGGKGASLMLGYFDDQKATEDSFNDSGWFLTGDLGWMDSAGFLRITGRKKDVIIRGGHNIYPARIEALAAKHPAIDKVVAFAVPDQRLGERVCMAIVLRNGQNLSDDELLAHLDAVGLSKYDMPESVIHLEALPLTASGKIVKRILSEEVKAGKLQPRPVKFKEKTPFTP